MWNLFSPVAHVEVTWVTRPGPGIAQRATRQRPPAPPGTPGPCRALAVRPEPPAGLSVPRVTLQPRLTASPDPASFSVAFSLSVALSTVSSTGKRTCLSCVPGRHPCLKRARHVLSGSCVECCRTSRWARARCSIACHSCSPSPHGPEPRPPVASRVAIRRHLCSDATALQD